MAPGSEKDYLVTESKHVDYATTPQTDSERNIECDQNQVTSFCVCGGLLFKDSQFEKNEKFWAKF